MHAKRWLPTIKKYRTMVSHTACTNISIISTYNTTNHQQGIQVYNYTYKQSKEEQHIWEHYIEVRKDRIIGR